jgi:PAS domain S-box-containing protein
LGNNLLHAQDRGLDSPEEIIGQNDYDFFPDDEANLYRVDDFEVIETKTAKLNIIEPQTRFDGSARWLRTSKVPLFDPGGEIIGILGTYEDITEQKIAEEDLKKAQNYITNVIDSMPSVLVGVDNDGKVTQWNREAEKVTARTPEKALNIRLEEAFPRLKNDLEMVHRAIQSREVQTVSQRPYKKNNEKRFEDVTVYPLTANGVEGAVIRVDDVTEKVRMKEVMIQSEKMLSVGGLAAGMAHEINNPLAGMLQTAYVLESRLQRDIPANLKAAEAAGTSMEAIRAFVEAREIPRMLKAINDSGQRIATIVENMLSFARRSDDQVSSHNLVELLDKAIDLATTDYDLKKQYEFKTIKIIREYEENLPFVPCESAKIQQAFLNILRNGAQAMQESKNDAGDTSIKPPCFTLRLAHEKESGMVRIEIEDNGRGMDEATRKRVFEPFFTTKSVGEGIGLGLSVAYFIVTENHGGTLDVVSEPGKGAKFIIRLPLKRGIP